MVTNLTLWVFNTYAEARNRFQEELNSGSFDEAHKNNLIIVWGNSKYIYGYAKTIDDCDKFKGLVIDTIRFGEGLSDEVKNYLQELTITKR